MPEKKVLLFTTSFCSKCPSIKKMLDLNGIQYEVVDAVSDPRAKTFSVRGVPTLIVTSEDGLVCGWTGEKNINLENIKEHLG